MFRVILTFFFFGSSFCFPGRNTTWTENELTTATGIFELFEGNSASQNMVCTLIWTEVKNNEFLSRDPIGTKNTCMILIFV